MLAPDRSHLPDVENFSRTLRRNTIGLVLALGLPALALLALVLFLFRSATAVDHSARVIAAAQRLEELTVDVENSLRSFQLDGDPALLRTFSEARAKITPQLEQLANEVVRDPVASASVAALRVEIARLTASDDEAMTRAQGASALPDAAAFHRRWRAETDAARARLDEIVRREEAVQARSIQVRNGLRAAVVTSVVLITLIGLPVRVLAVRRLLRRVRDSYVASLSAAEHRATELHVALRSIGDAVIATDEASRVAFLNPVAEQLTGWKNDEARGRPLAEVFVIFNEETGAPVETPVERVLREGKVLGLANHTVLRSRDGCTTPIEDSAAPLIDESGAIRGVILVFHDVFEKREVERRLHEAEWRARTALEVGGAGSWVYDLAEDRITGDAMLARTFGVPLERCLAGEPLSAFLARVNRNDRELVRAAMQHAADTGETYEFDFQLVHEDGSERWVHARGRPEPGAGGRLGRLLGFLLDITEARATETALRESETRFRFLDEIGDATRALGDPAEIMAAVTRLLGMHLHASRCVYGEVEADGEHFTIPHDYTDGCASIVGDYQLTSFGPRAALALRAGETLLICDVDAELTPVEREIFTSMGMKALIARPLLKLGALRAWMAVHQTSARAWTAGEVSLVEEVTERCWAVIERARAEGEVRERARLSALRADIGLQLASAQPLAETLQACCALLVRHLDAAFARVWTLSASEPVLELVASAGIYTHLDGPHSRVPVGEFKIGRIAESKQAHLTNDVPHDPNVSDHEWAAREKMVAFAGYPLVIDGRLVGVVAMFARRPLSEAVLGDLAPIADSIAQCIDGKRAAAALHASETLKTAIINTSLDGFILMNHEGVIVDWNHAAENIFGRERAAAIGQALGETIVPARLRAAHHAGVARYVASREARILGQRYELPALRADGTEFPCEISITHIAGTEPPLFAGFVRDITERQQAAAALATSEARLRLVLESATDLAIMTTDLNGAVTLWNSGAAQLFGWPVTDITGSSAAVLFTEEDRAAGVPEREMREATEHGRADDERWHVRRDGSRFFASGLMMPLRDGNGEIIGFLKVARDRTAQQLDQQERAHLLRITEEARAEAEAARHRAEAASKAKDDFLAALSHELRTPLTPVLMTATALRDDERIPADARDQLSMVARNIALEARLIDDLLDLTRIAKGKLPLRTQPCDAHSLIGLAVEIVREEAHAKAVGIELNLAARRSGIVADPARFQQVIWNLLRNAVKFTPRNGRVAIRTRDEPPNEEPGRFRVEVSDSGIGIAPEALEHIFLPFEQAGLANDHRFGGMGLGLAIARAIVDLHGGTIRAESAGPNLGATFTVEFPGATEAPPGFTSQTQLSCTPLLPGAISPAPTASHGPLRLLLVEDHEPTLQVLARLLSRAGHQVTAVSTVADALAAAKGGKFDAVISDLGLPDGTGTALMKTLRELHGLRGIALSGYGMEGDLARSREAGFALHLTKPVDFSQLERALAELVDGAPTP